ncbi:hypothetical protein GCM10023210_12430 [Chryseobacterium ginsengisoli]|uniref:Knr4/Smi1-like domain-containing protein n=1 Tax=Chryseobacterium ginsengisoli TaxID=363853 RepID=A0ABP9LZB8_9FLAO
MSKAELWAESYFQRLNKTLEELNKHSLINHLTCMQFEGITDEEILKTETELLELLKSNAEDNGTAVPSSFKFDEYMKAFYKISNGLHISWDSHILQSSLTESEILTSAAAEKFKVAYDDLLQAEGFLSLLPLKNLISYSGMNIYGDPTDSRFGQEIRNQGGHFTYLDFYYFYNDTCIVLNDQDNSGLLYHGDDHSAHYDSDKVSDFVIYMEYLLATRFSVFLRHTAFHNIDTIDDFRKNNYEDIADKIHHENQYADIDDILKYHALDENLLEKFGDLEYLQSKPEEIYRIIEDLLEIVLEDEL